MSDFLKYKYDGNEIPESIVFYRVDSKIDDGVGSDVWGIGDPKWRFAKL